MLKKVLIYVFIGMVLALIVLWLYAGGYAAVRNFVRTIPNPIDILTGNSTSTYEVKFPWAIAPPQGPDISGFADDADAILASDNGDSSSGSDSSDTAGSAAPQASAADSRSPYIGAVSIASGAASNDPRAEFLVLDASPMNGNAISVSGWSLKSDVSGKRAYIPQAESPYIPGGASRVGPIALSPGGSVVLISSVSPVGVSFQDNACTGYLTQSITDTGSYAGCMNSSDRGGPSFARSTWHGYLGYTTGLWGAHDSIELLDGSGHVVTTITY